MADNTRFFGTGQGEAQVFNTGGLANQFTQLLAKKQAEQRAQRQQEIEQLQAQQNKLNPTGLRNDADRDSFFNQVSDWREKSIAAMNERDPYKKAKANAEAQQAYMMAQDLVGRSKGQAEYDKQMGALLLDPTKRYKFTPEAVKQYQENLKRGVSDPQLIKNYSSLGLAPDMEYFNKNTKTFNEDLLKGATQSLELGKKYRDAAGNIVQNQSAIQRIKVEDLAQRIAANATADQRYLVALEAKHPEVFAQVQDEAQLGQAIQQAAIAEAQAGILSRPVGTPRIYNPQESMAEKMALHRANRLFDIANPTREQKEEQVTYFQDLSERMRTGVPGSGEELSAIFKSNPSYLRAPDMKVFNDRVEITIPAKYKTDVKKLEGYNKGDKIPANADRVMVEKPITYTIDKNNPAQWTNTMAQIYKQATGEPVNPSKANTPQGKGLTKKTEAPAKTIKVSLNGQVGEIPADKYNDFKKKYPKAQKLN